MKLNHEEDDEMWKMNSKKFTIKAQVQPLSPVWDILYRDSINSRLFFISELDTVQIAGNSSILELKSHTKLTSGGYHVEYWSHENVTKESHNQIQNCHYRGRHRGHNILLSRYNYVFDVLRHCLLRNHFHSYVTRY